MPSLQQQAHPKHEAYYQQFSYSCTYTTSSITQLDSKLRIEQKKCCMLLIQNYGSEFVKLEVSRMRVESGDCP